MLGLLMYLILITLVIIGLASVIPIITVVLLKIKERKQTTRIIYEFSSELFEIEYSETMWKEYNEEYEKKKVEEYSKKLP